MNQNDFNKLVSATLQEAIALMGKKSNEYAEEKPDRLEAFKRAAALQDVTPTAALFGMLAKHTVSLAIMASNPNPAEYPMSQWKEKIIDSINYHLLLLGTVEEARHEDEAITI